MHTILGALRPPLDLRAPEREVVPSYDGNPICLDWWLPTHAETTAAAASVGAASVCVRALVVILPGLTGSSREFYVRRTARQLLRANMAVCVLNARGVADTPLEKPQIFSALFTKDLRHIMQSHVTRDRLQERFLCRTPPLQTEHDDKGAVPDFDEYITGPHFGFPGAEAYYAAANSFRRLHHSRTPQVCVVAANNPICGTPQPASLWLHLIEQHPGGLVYVEMPAGGHLGFLGCPWSEWT
ncbi:hypothetical protein JIQ42_06739 [Leishmania sp. Namibia]|uniref:hypothetical protein n=1 Tax=Leishmania sp. Namibia TaxID=2802991 RepID=UPI001B480DD5|nr:hypothetical protein JIQ42_06739 [Leishmania sp. Namibia]